VAPNLLEQKLEADRQNAAWVTDITYIAADEGWLCVAGIKDLYTCEIVGYAMGPRMTQVLVGEALFRAVRSKRPRPGLIHRANASIMIRRRLWHQMASSGRPPLI
jgi:transposase InsO family protein